jgi:predicted transcriptional regulator
MKMKPDATKHNPDAAYLRELVSKSGKTQEECAELVGVSARMMRYYLSTTTATFRPASYTVQFALECLADPRS